jgi:hypothetical protein
MNYLHYPLQVIVTRLLELIGRRLGVKTGCREIIRWVLVLMSACLVVLCLLDWVETREGHLGIIQAVARGVPFRWIFVPIIGLIIFLLFALNIPGAYTLTFLLGFVLFALIVSSMPLEKSLKPGWGLYLSLISGLVYPLVGLVGAIDEPVPLNSILARLAYFGAFGHFKSLYHLAEKWGWEVSGPASPDSIVRVKANWYGRDEWIESGLHSTLDSAHYFLRITIATKCALWPFRVAVSWPERDNTEWQESVSGTCHKADGGITLFHLWRPSDAVVSQSTLNKFGDVLNSGNRFLRKRTRLQSSDGVMLFERHGLLQMTEGVEDMEQLLQWLSDIARFMEQSALSDEFEMDEANELD